MARFSRLFARGKNYTYNLGVPGLLYTAEFVPVPFFDDLPLKKIVPSLGHTLFLSREDEVFCAGWVLDQQSAMNTFNMIDRLPPFYRWLRRFPRHEARFFFRNMTLPRLLSVSGGARLLQFEASGSSLYYLTEGRQLFVQGENYCGQLGKGEAKHLAEPQPLDLPPVDRLAVGKHFAVLRSAGRWLGAGRCRWAQFPVKQLLDAPDQAAALPDFRRFVPLFTPFEADEVFCGESFTFFREKSGRRLIACGLNRAGQCGLPYFDAPTVARPTVGFDLDALRAPPDERIERVAAGPHSSLVQTGRALYFVGSTTDNRLPAALFGDEAELGASCGVRLDFSRLPPEARAGRVSKVVHALDRTAVVLDSGTAVVFGGRLRAHEFGLQLFRPADFGGLKVRDVQFGPEWEFVYCESDEAAAPGAR